MPQSQISKAKTKSIPKYYSPSFFLLDEIPKRNLLSVSPTSAMVIPLGPGKFYGTSLPRPRFYTDVKLNSERVDPPVPVLDPLLSWANEAHWSMGGLSFKRLRLQGRIEGNISKLRAEREKLAKKKKIAGSPDRSDPYEFKKMVDSPSPPPAPMATKKRRFMTMIEEDRVDRIEEAKSEVVKNSGDRRRRLVKKLNDDFDKVAYENDNLSGTPLKDLTDDGSKAESYRTRRRKLEENDGIKTMMQVVEDVNKMSFKGKKLKEKTKETNGSSPKLRTSPRLAKRD